MPTVPSLPLLALVLLASVDAAGTEPSPGAESSAVSADAGVADSAEEAGTPEASNANSASVEGPEAEGLPPPLPRNPHLADEGRELFRVRCAICHGPEGEGDGPNARFLDPRPRNLVSSPYKIAATAGVPREPTDAELRRVIRAGLPGTAMPKFRALREPELEALIAFLRTKRGKHVHPDPESAESRGRTLYASLQCARCHGDSGAGDGPSEAELVDEEGRRIRATDLRRPSTFKLGARREEVVRTLLDGMPGTPMPGYSGAITSEQAADLVAYLESLSLHPAR